MILPLRLAIIEDNIPFRETLEAVLNTTAEIRVVATLKDCGQIVPVFREANPQVVLMDIELKGSDSGIEGVKIVRNYFPDAKILMFTVFEDEERIFQSICAGASGYLLKKTPPDEIVKALVEVYEGGAPMTPSIARKALQLFRERMAPVAENNTLSAREREILLALSEGFTYQKIADKLFISISTVRTHICHIYEKLQVNSKVEAIRKFQGM